MGGIGIIKNKIMHTNLNNNFWMIVVAVLTIIVVWLIGSFIVMDLRWPINTIAGRCLSIILVVSIIKSALNAA